MNRFFVFTLAGFEPTTSGTDGESFDFKKPDKSEDEEQFASDSERNSKPRGNGAAALRQAVE